MSFDLSIPDHAYLFGFLQGDSHHAAGSRQRGRVQTEIAQRDVELLREFQRIVPYPSSIRFRTRTTNFAADYTSATWTVHALEARTDLRKLGLPTGRKAAIIAPPTVAFSRPDYLRGLIDADGSIGFTAKGWPFVSIATTSEAIAAFFSAQVLQVTGATRKPGRNVRDGAFNVMVTNDPAAEMAAFLYYDGCLALTRKATAAARIGEWRRPAGMRARYTKRPWTPAEDAVILTRPIREMAAQLGRTERSVNARRWRLRHANEGDRP